MSRVSRVVLLLQPLDDRGLTIGSVPLSELVVEYRQPVVGRKEIRIDSHGLPHFCQRVRKAAFCLIQHSKLVVRLVPLRRDFLCSFEKCFNCFAVAPCWPPPRSQRLSAISVVSGRIDMVRVRYRKNLHNYI